MYTHNSAIRSLLSSKIWLLLVLLLLPVPSWAAGAAELHLDGGNLSILWILPFAGILLSIAIIPLFFPHFWHHHFGKISAFWALSFLIPFSMNFGISLTFYEILHTLFLEYIPFIILLLALYTVAGGVQVTGSLVGTPLLNTTFLAIGTIAASIMGTTGAAMLLVRPLIRANEHRTTKTHIFVFFIFLVANIGGSLTPLGDPPLFLGFLKGVSFFWPTTHLLFPMLICSVILLVTFFIFDSLVYAKEKPHVASTRPHEPPGIKGGINLLLLCGIIASVLMSGILKLGHIEIYHIAVDYQNILRDILLLAITGLSLKLTSTENRLENGFSWFPIIEVGKLFAGIFLTIIPAIAILKAGTSGALGSIVSAVSNDGQPVNIMYFWLTGLLSSFLDNAPTYLVFFNTAGGDAGYLMTQGAATLAAISAGAVFMGANTYIGNAPNFMVRAIVEERGIAMPSFFGYMAWSGIFLLPLFVLLSFLFFI